MKLYVSTHNFLENAPLIDEDAIINDQVNIEERDDQPVNKSS